jgi:hypothetical protein
MSKFHRSHRGSTQGRIVAAAAKGTALILLVHCAPHATSTPTAPTVASAGHENLQPGFGAQGRIIAAALRDDDLWRIPGDLQLDSPPVHHVSSLSIPPAPERLLAPDPACQTYVHRRPKPSSESCPALLDASAREPLPERRDAWLVAASQKCPFGSTVQVLRAQAAPGQCAEPLAVELLKKPPPDLTPELRDIVHAQLLRGRLARFPAFRVALKRGKFDVDRWAQDVLAKAYSTHAGVLELLTKAAEPLTGEGGALAWAYIALAWRKLEVEVRFRNYPPNLVPTVDDRHMHRVWNAQFAQANAARQAHYVTGLRALDLAAKYLEWADPSLLEVSQSAIASRMSIHRDFGVVLKLIDVDLYRPPRATEMPQTPAYATWVVPLCRLRPTSLQGCDQWLDPASSALGQARSLDRTLRAVRARIKLAVAYGSARQLDSALSLLSSIAPSERDHEARLLAALALALRSGLLTLPIQIDGSCDLHPLDSIASAGGPWSNHAALFAGLFRFRQATTLGGLERLEKLDSACHELDVAGSKLPPHLAVPLNEAIQDCHDYYKFLRDEICARAEGNCNIRP